MEPWGCFVAEEGDGKIVGAAIAVMWGTVGLIGPVAVLTNYQNQDIGQQLLTACQEFFDENKATLQGLATYPYSPKHLVLYQKFGYKPKGLVVVTSKTLDRNGLAAAKPAPKLGLAVRRYSTLEEARKKQVMQKVRRITNALWRGLDLAKEIEIVDGLTLGDTLLLEKGREVIGFAVCHLPPNSEAPHGSAYVKLLAIDSRHRKPEHLHALLAGVEELAAAGQLQRVVVPAYTYYWTAYQTLLERGYHVDFTMVRMKQGKLEDYEDASDLVLDDWR
jgi:N-acetylglutamate synthase-like GNAT family acetyltransferase